MKSKKVLLGLFLGLFASFTGIATAQTNSGSNLVELGPDNIGGRITSLVVDQHDPSHQTIYAGAASGGLFIKSTNPQFCQYATIWEHIPFLGEDGKEVVLPISSMVQAPNNEIIIATGEGSSQRGSRATRLGALGRGMFRFNPDTRQFTIIPGTESGGPGSTWDAINKVTCFERNGVVYYFAATNSGLYRWAIANENDWNNGPALVSDAVAIYDVQPIPAYNMLYFSTANGLFRIGNVERNDVPVDISQVNAAFSDGNVARIYMAAHPDHPDYFYAMVVGKTGLMKGVYMTQNQSTWDTLSSSTVLPFSFTAGDVNGAICVSPKNPGQIMIGGTSLWAGQGYIPHSFYQWTKSSSSEFEYFTPARIPEGDFMANIYSDASFVHSGINQIVGTFVNYDTVPTYYIATDGGVFVSYNEMNSFSNINRGLNTIQANSVAVAQDGSVLLGANNNASIFIESRMGHHGGRGEESWYDHNPEFNMNHLGAEIFRGDGGGVAVSKFQQYAPATRRNIFMINNYSVGRSFNDYNDYNNTQTWTIGTSFAADKFNSSYSRSSMVLWETMNDTRKADSIEVVIDTLAFAYSHDTSYQMKPGTTIKKNDTIWVNSVGHAGYPFKYVFPKAMTLHETDTIIVKNPMQNHLFVVGGYYVEQNGHITHTEDVNMTWMPTDFRKVCYETTVLGDPTAMSWAKVYSIDKTTYPQRYFSDIAVSNNGDALFVAVNDEETKQSFIVRVSGIIDSVDYSAGNVSIFNDLNLGVGRWMNTAARLKCDTLMISESIYMPRMISSLKVDPRPGTDALLVTFEGYGSEYTNVLFLKNATAASPKISAKPLALGTQNIPVYSSLIEYTTGEVYLGTEEGVYNCAYNDFDASTTPTWQEYGNFRGVPVTAMCQQTDSLKLVRFTGHTGIMADKYIFPKTKYPFAMYFATYGRGVFMDTYYVTDMENEIVDSSDFVDIPRVRTVGSNKVSIYPNPAVGFTNVELTVGHAGNAQVRIYDLNGKLVMNQNWGPVSEGTTTRQIDCQNFQHGMYLINVTVGRETATSKLVVR